MTCILQLSALICEGFYIGKGIFIIATVSGYTFIESEA